ncbi:MAG: hypothetical protein CME36_06845 [unclassified Hahellaceae]|nr:hypothetical protein [Hahellaceae bacterium]
MSKKSLLTKMSVHLMVLATLFIALAVYALFEHRAAGNTPSIALIMAGIFLTCAIASGLARLLLKRRLNSL